MSVSRSPAHFPLIVVFVIAFIGSTNLLSLAQEENVPEKRPFRHQGQLTNVQAPFLEVRVGDKTWVYKVEAEVDQIKYIAQAETSWLRPGMYVRYDGADEKGRTVEPIKELFVFSPRPEFPVGIQDEADGSFLIAGRIKNLKNGRLTLLVGRRKTIVTLDEEAEIRVNYANLDLMQLGDNVEASGEFYVEGKGIATTLVVTAKDTLKSRDKKKRRRRRREKTKRPNAASEESS
ncbi:MAG: hypothetical protein MK179_02025 [Pirellulaceae bacterium]|nr:hypothetical protein [Pirellulaceae bacterium]